MPYTSGSTGLPKGCMHTHAGVLHNVVGSVIWKHVTADTVALATAPFFHVTGLVHSFLATVQAGGTIVIQQRWDPAQAAALVERHRCTHWDNVPTMVVDLLSNREAMRHDVSSLKWIFGGGAAMPEAIAQKLKDICGVDFIEGYGLTETISQTHMNPPDRPKRQCLGIPVFDTESFVIDPDTLRILPPGEQGEIVVRGPQLLTGYWKKDEATRARLGRPLDGPGGGKSYFRTGDLGHMDEDGYFFISDRLKRMINAAGLKVWPAQVEAAMYRHPAIRECCIIATPDARKGESVKAVVVLKAEAAAHHGGGHHRVDARADGGLQGAADHRLHRRASAHALGEDPVAYAAGEGVRQAGTAGVNLKLYFILLGSGSRCRVSSCIDTETRGTDSGRRTT